MRKPNFAWGVVLAIVVLAYYAYLSFLGMLYRGHSSVTEASLAALGLMAVVGLCVYFMCVAKATKWRQVGTVGQAAFAVVILAAYILASFPFTSYISLRQHKSELTEHTEAMKQAAARMDEAYNAYAEARVGDYRTSLPADEGLRAASLERRLVPTGIDSIQAARSEWLSSIGDLSPRNIYMPANLKYLQECVNDWRQNYIDLSSIYYSDELSPKMFEYAEFENSMSDLQRQLSHPPFSLLALLIAVICSAAMLIPYWFIQPAPEPDTEDLWEEVRDLTEEQFDAYIKLRMRNEN